MGPLSFGPSAGRPTSIRPLSHFTPSTPSHECALHPALLLARGIWPTPGDNANIVPVVANGKVYVASYKALTIFGAGGARAAATAPKMASQAAAQPSPLVAPTSTHLVSGILTAIDRSTLTLQTRSGKSVKIDDAQAVQNQRVGAPLSAGIPLTVQGSTRPCGKTDYADSAAAFGAIESAMTHISGFERSQILLLPEAVDDYVGADNPVRFIDAFVDELDLAAAGFSRVEPKATGRPGYSPADLLKLYIYGYLNRVRSSRRLEMESHRNIEVVWLLRSLKPDFKTIADFRRDNRVAFRSVFREFVLLCRRLDLYGRELLAVDGTRIKAVNNKDRNFTRNSLQDFIRAADERLDDYLRRLDEGDIEEGGTGGGAKPGREDRGAPPKTRPVRGDAGGSLNEPARTKYR